MQATTFVREDNWLEKLLRKKSFWLVFWLVMFSYPIYRSIYRELPPPLPVYGQVPDFVLKNEFGKDFGMKDLKGKFWIANFFFTSCPTSCPKLMETMNVIQKRIKGLGTKAAIVSFSVDPEVDTPQVLYKFARETKSNPYVWNFLTGEKAQIEQILVKGFKVPIGGKEPVEGMVDGRKVTVWDIVHSEKAVLIDAQGRIRGYYATDKVGVDKMMIDMGLLVNDSFNYHKKEKI